MRTSSIKVKVRLATPESQEVFEKIVAEAKKNTKGAMIEIQVLSKKLTPLDVLLALAIQVGARLLYDLIQRLTRDFSANKIECSLDFEARQLVAESLLLKSGVEGIRLEKRMDLAGSSEYTFKDKKGRSHFITVSSNGACTYKGN